jgi:membrane fusion protein
MLASRPLFRPEAVDAQRQPWLGGVQLARPPGLAWMTAGALAVLLALVAFLSLASYTRKASAPGVLTPDRGLMRVVPAAAGTVLERRVQDGDAVRAGDVLFVLALARPLLDGDARSEVQRSLDARRRHIAEATQAQRELAATRVTAIDRRQAALQAEQAQLDAEAALQQQRLALAEAALARLRALEAEQFVSPAQVQAKTEEVIGLRAAAQALVRQRAALAREAAELDGERRAEPLAASGRVSTLQRELAQADREAAEHEAEPRLVVRAAQAGTVATVLAQPGDSVTPQAALATVMPEGAVLQAQLYAPSSAVGFVQPGQPVRLRYEAFPYAKFGHQDARVVQVSRTPLAAGELAALALPAGAGAGEPLFRITVAIDAPREDLPLAPGMRLVADVMLEQRRLVEWLFEPLLRLRGRL